MKTSVSKLLSNSFYGHLKSDVLIMPLKLATPQSVIVQMFHLINSLVVKSRHITLMLLTSSLMHFAILKLTINTFGNTKQ